MIFFVGLIMTESKTIAGIVQAEVVGDRQRVSLTLQGEKGEPIGLSFRTEFLAPFIYSLQTVSSSLTQLQPGRPPVPGERFRVTFMEATDVTLGSTNDSRTMLRFDTVQ